MVRREYQLTRDRVRLQNQLEALLEEAQVKLSSLVSDLFGASARRMLQALAEGETNPAALSALADYRMRAKPHQLCDALGASQELSPVYRRLLKMMLEELRLIEQQMDQLDHEMAELLSPHRDVVQRLAEVPGLGVNSAHQIIAEVGAVAATFPSEKHSFRKAPCFLGWGMPGSRRKRRHLGEQPVSEGESFHAASSQSGGPCRNQSQGQHIRTSVSAATAAFGLQTSPLGHCPPSMSADLEDFASRCALRGTRPGGEQKVDRGTRRKNDPRTPNPWLPCRSHE